MTISRFVAAGNTYTFPTTTGDQEFRTNFANLLRASTRLPGVDGGYREWGWGKAPAEMGMIQFGVYLESATRSGMQALRDSLRTMQAWGMGLLYDTINGVDRWCYCAITSIDMPEDRHKHSDLFQRVQLTFETPDPFWYTAGNELLWDSAGNWDGTSLYWDGTSPTNIVNSGTVTVTNNGSAYTLARVILKCTTGTAYNPVVQRTVNGVARDEVGWSGSLAATEWLEIDSRRHSAYKIGSNELANITYRNRDWIRLEPGSNTIAVRLNGTVDVYVRYMERYA